MGANDNLIYNSRNFSILLNARQQQADETEIYNSRNFSILLNTKRELKPLTDLQQ